jgi:hypothetical protein
LQIGLVSGGQFSSFGRIPIGLEEWYEQTAGICEFPADRSLSAAELSQLDSTPIGVVQQIGATRSLVAMEGVDGLHVRAEDFVYRMSANDTATVTLRASRFGRPLPNAAISLTFDSSGLQQQGSGNLTVGTPATGLSFPPNVTTDAQGIASVSLTAGTLGKPRDYIDGQVYGMRYTLAQSDPNNGGYFDPADFISVLVWTDYQIPSDPNWTDDVQPILKQYEQLYPVMKSVGVTLGNYASVVAHKDQMRDVFMRPQEDAHYMPVTRDLSPAKRQMILNWLQTTGNAGQPNLGPKPAVVATAPIAALEVGVEGDLVAKIGGKSAAMRKRVGGPQQRAGFMRRTI